jgi:hypothetical protein
MDSERRKTLNHQFEVENKVLETQWTCCSNSKIDKRCVSYFTQVIFGMVIVAFSIFKLSTGDGDDPLYVGLLSSTIGIFLPTPKIN